MSNQRTPLIVSIVFGLLGLAWVLVMGKLIIGALFFLAAAGAFVRFKAAANPGMNAFWTKPRVLVAGFFGIIAALLLTAFVPRIGESMHDVTMFEGELAKTQRTLETMDYDANGNVSADRRFEFEMAISSSKYLPSNLRTARENLTVSVAMSGIALLVLAGCGLVIGFAAKRRERGVRGLQPLVA